MADHMGGGHGLSWRETTPQVSRYRHPPGSAEALRRDAIAEIGRSFTRTSDDLGWMDGAACVEIGGDAFFPRKGEPSRAQKKICAGCPVREQCEEFGEGQGYGLWGGKSRNARRDAKRARRQAGQVAA